jgi:hypothetical protein
MAVPNYVQTFIATEPFSGWTAARRNRFLSDLATSLGYQPIIEGQPNPLGQNPYVNRAIWQWARAQVEAHRKRMAAAAVVIEGVEEE